WTRTEIDKVMVDGSKALYFDWTDLALFDLFILERPDSRDDYPSTIVDKAQAKFAKMTKDELKNLSHVILMGIPGEGDISIESLKNSIEQYKSIGKEGLRQNHKLFLSAIQDVCEDNSIRMTIH